MLPLPKDIVHIGAYNFEKMFLAVQGLVVEVSLGQVKTVTRWQSNEVWKWSSAHALPRWRQWCCIIHCY